MKTGNEVIKVDKNSLVVYSRFNGNITSAVQECISINDIHPENRVLVDGGMYVASATNLELDASGFKGFLYLAFYQEVDSGSKKAFQSLSVLVLNKIFSGIDVRPRVVYDGRNYERVWRLWSDEGSYGHWLIRRGPDRDEIGKIKVQLINKHKLLFSNDFLSVLFNPVLDALMVAYEELGKF